jgi:rare lipoprotein A
MASTTTMNSTKSFRRVLALGAATGIAVMGSVAQQAHAAPVGPSKTPAQASHASAPRQIASAPAQTPKTRTHVWATTNVNVRSGAGLSHSRIGLLRTGHYTTQLEASHNGWTKVRYHGQVGYIYSQYLTHSGSTASSGSTSSYAPRHSAGPSTSFSDTSRSSQRQSYTPRHSAESTSSSGSSSTRSSSSSTSSSNTSGGGSCQASFYGSGSQTASGESFDSSAMTAASKTYSFGTKLRVTNQANGKSVVVRINDRGPYVSGRCLDLSTGAFSQIASTDAGVTSVSYQVVS